MPNSSDSRRHAARLAANVRAGLPTPASSSPQPFSSATFADEGSLRAEHSDDYEGGYEDEGNDASAPEAANLLNDVTIDMVVELGRVNVSAADVMGLRPGQVIELTKSPSNPVDLVVDGKRIGQGELVEIEGELGVRILSLAAE